MAYLFDTNIFSELRRKDRMDPAALACLEAIPAIESYVSVISLMEIEIALLSIERRDRHQGDVLRRWFVTVLHSYAPARVLPIDQGIAQRCAALNVPDRRSPYDALIAATAITHGMTLVTRNLRDFQIPGLTLLDPWAAA